MSDDYQLPAQRLIEKMETLDPDTVDVVNAYLARGFTYRKIVSCFAQHIFDLGLNLEKELGSF